MDRIDQSTPQPTPTPHPTAPLPPAAWSDDDNKPVIPRIPGPRKATAAHPLPRQAVGA